MRRKEHPLCPVSVIGRLLAVKCWADHEDVHAAVCRRNEEQEAGLHKVRHLSGEGCRHKNQDAEIREVRGVQAHAAQILGRRVVARRRRGHARNLVLTSAKRLLSDLDSGVSEWISWKQK